MLVKFIPWRSKLIDRVANFNKFFSFLASKRALILPLRCLSIRLMIVLIKLIKTAVFSDEHQIGSS